jgi:uncharacterized protein
MTWNPRKEYVTTPAALGLKYEELKVATPDRYDLNTWVLMPGKARDNRVVMILAYGDAMNMSYWLEQCYYFMQKGFTVITFDYRGFGKSSTFATDSSQLYYDEFATDLSSVIRYARGAFKDRKVGVRALSMGTIISVLANQRTPLDYIIGDSFIADPVGLQKKYLSEDGRNISLPESASKFINNLATLKTPLLVFAGTSDKVISPNDARKMVAGGTSRKLVEYNGGHLAAIYVMSGKNFGEMYIDEIRGFLEAGHFMKRI